MITSTIKLKIKYVHKEYICTFARLNKNPNIFPIYSYLRMDGQMTDGRTVSQMKRQTDGQTDRDTKETNKWTDKRTNKQTDKHTVGQTDKWTDKISHSNLYM